MTDPAKAALRANQEHYAEPGAFAYVADRYHSRRMQVATEMLAANLDASRPGLVLLDIGPGDTSPIGAGLYPHASRIAIDASAEALAGAQGFTTRICADVTAGFPLGDESVDAIFCGELVEHLFDPIGFLREAARVLVPEGLIVVTTPNIATLQDRVRFVLGRAPRHVDPLHHYIRLHIRPFTPELLERALASAGIEIQAIKSNYVDIHVNGKRYNIPGIAKMFPRLGGTIIALGMKPANC